MKSIKISYQQVNKRVSEPIDYNELIKLIPTLFPSIQEIDLNQYTIYYIENLNCRKAVKNNEEFTNILRDCQSPIRMEIVKENIAIALQESKELQCQQMIQEQKQQPQSQDQDLNEFNLLDDQSQNQPEIINKGKENEEDKKQQEIKQEEVQRDKEVENNDSKEEMNDIMLSKIDQLLTSRLADLENRFEKIFQSQSIKSNIQQQPEELSKITYNNISNTNKISSNTIKDKDIVNKLYTNEYCSYCKNPTLSKKFICVVCDQLILCELCQDQHIVHPLIRIVQSNNNKGLVSRNDIIKYLQTKKMTKKREKQGAIQYFFNQQMKLDFYLRLQTKNGLTSFAIPRNKITTIVLVLSSQALMNIDEEIYFIVINNHFMKVSHPNPLQGIKAFGHQEMEISFDPQNQILAETIEISIQVKETKIVIEPLVLEIKVVDPPEVELENANIFFKDYEEIANISAEDKIEMFNLFKSRGKSNVKKINKILSKYNIQIPS